ncbi:MAG: hypothetical protein MOGMAGMI_00935 [Candidatus Omnitrophica bacterium]|nr:hypothetical protein [Candidatus Omnitrophota bacterium]
MRKKYWMGHPLQSKYLLFTLIVMLTPALLVTGCLYALIFRLLERQIAFPEAVASNVIPVIEQVNGILLVALPVVVAVGAILAVRISHRLVGPVQRLESELDRLASGRSKEPIRMRSTDDLKGVAERINRLMNLGQ